MIEIMIALWLAAVAVVLYIYFIRPMIEQNYQDKIKLELMRRAVFDALILSKYETSERKSDAIPDTVDELIAGFEND